MKKSSRRDNELKVTQQEGMSKERSLAEIALHPRAGAAAIVGSFSKPLFGPTEIQEIYSALSDRVRDVGDNKLASVENMLTAQAAALNAIFIELARRSGANMGDYIEAADRYMRLALKAEGQCRATLETLAAIKNPPVVYARQANIAAGPQQVNNGPGTPAGAGKVGSKPNELLESDHGKRLDERAEGAPGGRHPQLATLDSIDRATIAGR